MESIRIKICRFWKRYRYFIKFPDLVLACSLVFVRANPCQLLFSEKFTLDLQRRIRFCMNSERIILREEKIASSFQNSRSLFLFRHVVYRLIKITQKSFIYFQIVLPISMFLFDERIVCVFTGTLPFRSFGSGFVGVICAKTCEAFNRCAHVYRSPHRSRPRTQSARRVLVMW